VLLGLGLGLCIAAGPLTTWRRNPATRTGGARQ
jgi:hypothetical protein